MDEHLYPILEFDPCRAAKLNPESLGLAPLPCERLVICFFPEVIEALLGEGKILPERVIPGENPLHIYRFAGTDTLLVREGVGCPACAGDLDAMNALGVRKVMFCGGGGVLDKNIEVGQLLLVEGAIRDEGFSYHYLPPSRVVYADSQVNERIARSLDRRGVSYLRGLVWTTDAIFRETAERIARRRAEGARIVEMEQAGCLAVAQFRHFDYAALIYGGDDVSQEEWAHRDWRSRRGMRYDLVHLCKELVEAM